MREYRARYKVEAFYYECMTAMPDETKYVERSVLAINDQEARKKAQTLCLDVGRGLIMPTVTLESLVAVEVKEIIRKVGLKSGIQLNLFNSLKGG
ncbi:MAG: hypothetical protein AABY26_01140 [Nanoarchaeota archaeon]